MRLPLMVLAAMALPTTVMAEVPGEDHPQLPRYGNAEIRAYRAPSHDSIAIPVKRVGDAKAAANVQEVEGEVTHIDYVVTPGVATAQIGGYYERLLRDAGFQPVFSCVGEKACGGGMGELIFNSGKVAPVGFADGLFGDRMRVIVARRGGTMVLVHVYEGPDRSTIYEAVVDGVAG